jgi:hypothetical protein
VFSQLIKTAQEKPTFGPERPDFIATPGRGRWGDNTGFRIQEFFEGQDFENSKHIALNHVNALSNSINRVLTLRTFNVGGIGPGTGRFTVFPLSPVLTTYLKAYWSEIKMLKRLLEKVQTGDNARDLNRVDISVETAINRTIDALSPFVSAHNDVLNGIRNKFRSSPDKRIQRILQQVAICEARLTVAFTGQDLSSDAKDEITKIQGTFGTPFKIDESQVSTVGWEMPKEFKVVKLPDAAPDIFGGTVAGSKAEILRNYDKLSNMDDKDFADSYQLLREQIQGAFNSNESKFSKSEQDNFELKMQTLKNRYYEILYRDKPKSSFTD